jgi:hypothetical protein
MTTSGTISTLYNVRDLVTDALSEISVVPAGQEPTAEDMALCIGRLDRLLKHMQADGCPVWREQEVTITLPAATREVTLSPRVIDVQEARLVQSSTFERPLQRWEHGQYVGIPNKDAPGYPTAYSVKKSVSDVKFRVWPVPAAEMTVKATVARVIEDVTDASETLDLPQEWGHTVMICLAENLLSAFSVPANDVVRITRKAAEAYSLMRDMGRPASITFGR